MDTDYPNVTEADMREGDFGLMYYRLRITNTGRRPINIAEAGLLGEVDFRYAESDLLWASESRHRLPIGQKTPVHLAEWASLEAGMEEDELIGQFLFQVGGPERVVGAYAVDTTGRRYETHVGAWRDFVVSTRNLEDFRARLHGAGDIRAPWWTRNLRAVGTAARRLGRAVRLG